MIGEENRGNTFSQVLMTIVCDRNLRIVDIINPQHNTILQHETNVLIGLNVLELENITADSNKESARVFAQRVKKAILENQNVYFEYISNNKNGAETFSIGYATHGSDGLLYVNILEIDEENMFEARNSYTNYVIDTIINNVSVGVYIRSISDDGTKRYVLFNDVVKELYGENNIQSSYHWSQTEEDRLDNSVIESDESLQVEKVLRDVNGDIKKWLIVTKKKITSKIGGFYIITTVIDITKRKENDMILEHQFALLNSMYDNMPLGIVIYDKLGKLLSVNKQLLTMFGIKNRADIIGTSLFNAQYLSDENKEKIKQDAIVEYEFTRDFDNLPDWYPLSEKTGQSIYTVKVVPIINTKQERDGFLQIYEDVTSRRNVEKELQQKHNQIETIYNTLPIGIELYDQDGILVEVNNYDLHLMGLSNKDSLLGTNLFENPDIPTYVKEKTRNGESLDYSLEFDYDIANDVYHDVHIPGKKVIDINSSVLKNLNGNTDGYLLVSQDITQRREKELLLNAVVTKFSTMFNSMSNGVEIYDKDGRLIDCNKSDLKIFGVKKKEELINSNISLYNNPNISYEKIQKLLNGQEISLTCLYDFDLVRKNNYYSTVKSGTMDLEVKVAPMIGVNGDHLGYVAEVNDVTLIRKSEEAIRRSNFKLNLILEASGLIVWEYDCIKECFESNDQNLYIKKDKRSISDYKKIVHSDSIEQYEKVKHIFDERIDTAFSEEFILVRPGSEDKAYMTFAGQPLTYDKDGKVLRYVGCRRDNTQIKTLLNKLQKANQKNELIINNLITGMVYVDNDFQVIWENVSALKKSLRVNKYIVGRKCYETVYNRTTPCENCVIKKVNERGSCASVLEYDENGTIITNTANCVKDANGVTVGYLCRLEDITESYNHKLELERSRENLNLALEAGNVSAWTYDIDKKYFTTIQGNTLAGEGIRMDDNLKILHPDDRLMQLEVFNDIITGKKQKASVVFRYIQSDGTYRHFESRMIGKKVGGKVVAITGTQKDITDVIEYQQELMHAKAAAEQSDKLKSAFLANMSHEIRTPLNAIVGFSELIQNTDDKDEKAEYMQIINTNNDLLLRLINDILDLSKVEAGIAVFKREKVEFSSYFNDLMKSMSQRVKSDQIEFMSVNPYKTCYLNIDKNRVAQILTNFTTNAIKYTTKGFIKVGYEVVDHGLKLYVSDSGIGIPKEKQNKLFQRFEKLDSFAQGTGLGLSIVKALTVPDGGKVGCSSEEGKGSTFWSWKYIDELSYEEKSVG